MKCVLCSRRKGKRFCPAKNALICAQCCGEKRVLEIDCPESCEYLKIGRSRESQQEGVRFFRTSDPGEQTKRARVLDKFEPVIVDIQTLIALERQAVHDLTDGDVADALDCLIKTLRTEEKGILYETTSGNLRAESLRRQLVGLVESYRHPKEPERPRVPLTDAIECLEVLHAVIARHLESGPTALSFVDFLGRNLKRSDRSGPSPSSIIIPGR
jgi:hypothetical protein